MDKSDKVPDIQVYETGTAVESQIQLDQSAARAVQGGSQTRVPVRFASLRGKARPPAEYMDIEEAMNTLGTRLYPTEWGIGSAWKKHPFQYSPKERKFVTYSLHRTRTGYRLRRHPVKPGLSGDKLKIASRIYIDVRKTLKSALEAGAAKASKMDQDGHIEPISDSQKGLWTQKLATIFYTGEFRENRNGAMQKYRVLINRQRFTRWLDAHTNESSNSHQKGPHGLLNALAHSLTDHIAVKDYTPSKAEMFDVLSETFADLGAKEGYLTDYTFQAHFWNDFAPGKKKSGRRSAATEEAFKCDRPELKQLIRGEYFRRQRNTTSA